MGNNPSSKYGRFRKICVPEWTGFAEKKLWDYLELFTKIAIPIVIPVTTWLGTQHYTNETNRRALLSKYFDQMTDLITKDSLLPPSGDPQNPTEPQTIARARTLSTLHELHDDKERKGLLIKFLAEAKLIKIQNPTVFLKRADISEAILGDAPLNGTDLTEAFLNDADLSGNNLTGAILNHADLSGSNLTGADLTRAVLTNTDLTNTDLSGSNLTGADLTGAVLTGADLREACFKQAKNFNMQQVKSAKHWRDAYYSPDFRKQLGLPLDTRQAANFGWGTCADNER